MSVISPVRTPPPTGRGAEARCLRPCSPLRPEAGAARVRAPGGDRTARPCGPGRRRAIFVGRTRAPRARGGGRPDQLNPSEASWGEGNGRQRKRDRPTANGAAPGPPPREAGAPASAGVREGKPPRPAPERPGRPRALRATRVAVARRLQPVRLTGGEGGRRMTGSRRRTPEMSGRRLRLSRRVGGPGPPAADDPGAGGCAAPTDTPAASASPSAASSSPDSCGSSIPPSTHAASGQ